VAEPLDLKAAVLQLKVIGENVADLIQKAKAIREAVRDELAARGSALEERRPQYVVAGPFVFALTQSQDGKDVNVEYREIVPEPT